MQRTWTRGPYTISTERQRLDLGVIHGFLSQSYWAQGRSLELVTRSIEASLPFGLYLGAAQVGFARVITDQVTLAWLADVFVLEAHRGQGLGVWLIDVVTGAPELATVRRWLLGTRDAHGLYRKFGFGELPPGELMGKRNPNGERGPT
jgi:GNAT superfamily N-acetyltransferase